MSDKSLTADFGTVLASSVHDMKNSLSTLINRVDEVLFLAESEIDISDNMTSELHQLYREGKRLNNNLVALLTIYKLENGTYEPIIQETSVLDFLEEALVDFQASLAHQKITLEIDCPDDLYWYFDPMLVTTILTNIINNNIRYTNKVIRVSAHQDQGWLRIFVDDDGNGYPPRLISLIDDLLHDRGDIHGTGLGLYFSAVAARVHENAGQVGSIRLVNDNDLGGGRFELSLP